MIALQNLRPHKIFWLSIPFVIVLLGLLPRGAYDIQLHDTYYIIASLHLMILFAILYALIGVIYWGLKDDKFFNWLSYFHVIFSIVPIIIILIGYILHNMKDQSFDPLGNWATIFLTCALLFLSAQCGFLLNIVLGLIRGKRDESL